MTKINLKGSPGGCSPTWGWGIAPESNLNDGKEGVLIPIEHTCIVQSEHLKNAYGLSRSLLQTALALAAGEVLLFSGGSIWSGDEAHRFPYWLD